MRIALPDGADLEVHVEGHGPDLLLVSGLGGTAGFWGPVVERLSDSFRTIRFDQRGIGGSSRGTAPCTIAQLAEDCLAVLDRCGPGKALMAGHSTGGCIVQSLAARAPDRVAGLILSGAWGRRSTYLTTLFRHRLALLRAAPREYASMGVFLSYPPEFLERNWSIHDAALDQAPARQETFDIVAERIEALLSFDGGDGFASLTFPCLVVGAKDDLVVPAFLQRELADLLPDARLHMMPRGGHFFPITRADAFSYLFRSWAGSAVR